MNILKTVCIIFVVSIIASFYFEALVIIVGLFEMEQVNTFFYSPVIVGGILSCCFTCHYAVRVITENFD